jgi:hypothetical protein
MRLPPLGAERAEEPIGGITARPHSVDIQRIPMTPGRYPTRSGGRSGKKARRIARSSSGHTARGRGFMK